MRAAAAYYEGREPLLTDAEYDALIERISTAADADGELDAIAQQLNRGLVSA